MSEQQHPRPRRYFGPSGPITWAFLDPERETQQLAELTEWVDWMRWRFTLDHRTVTECWAQHGAVVEELSALYTAWQASYAYSNDGAAPLHWMTQFAFARQRLSDWNARSGCRPGEHRVFTDGLLGQR
jgi:hypothetical protein